MKQLLKSLDTPTRREFIERCAATSFGLSIVPAAQIVAADSEAQKPASFGKAKSVIWLMLGGGLSHIDSLDPKQGKSKGRRLRWARGWRWWWWWFSGAPTAGGSRCR